MYEKNDINAYLKSFLTTLTVGPTELVLHLILFLFEELFCRNM